MTDKEIEKALIAACDKAIERGYKITPGEWVDVNNKCCCPYGAAILVKSGFDEIRFIDGVDSLTTISKLSCIPYIIGFATTFDGDEDDPALQVSIALNLRKRYIDGDV